MCSKYPKASTLFFLGILLILSSACGGEPSPEPQITPLPSGVHILNINEVDTVTSEITQKKIFNQCDSASPFRAQVEFSDSSGQASQQQLVLKGGASGEVGISAAAKIELETAIEQHFASSVSSNQEHQESVTIEVPPYIQQEYTIVWRETKREGVVEYEENGERKIASYSYRIGLELISATGKDIPCPGQSTRVTPTERSATSASPTDTPQPAFTATPLGLVSQVFQVEGETAKWGPLETGIYVQSGDRVQITYLSGEWWIGQSLNNNWQPQTPTDGNGYTGREGDRVASLLGVDNPNRCRPLVSAPFGSLIGSIGKEGALFLIGNGIDFVAQDSGILYLRINYLDHNRVTNCPYGDGGVITVRVTITPP